MEAFLRGCQDAVKGDVSGRRLHVVMGNEACDLDSMVSALVYAYFLFKTQRTDGLVVPVCNVPRAELSLRTDNVFLLRESGLSPDLLLFRPQLDLGSLQRAGRLELTLVDHNTLPSSDSALEGAVVEVIDHHRLERSPSSSCPVTVETVGSCCTLVTERLLQQAPGILDPQIALLLYGTIVVDCVNMAPEAGKVTPKDNRYAALLEERFPSLPPRDGLFQSLQSAKFDVSGLTTEQMLLKDMKTASGGGLSLVICVIYMPLEKFLQRADLDRELSDFCQKNGYDLLLGMTISFNAQNQPSRQLAVYSDSPLYREEISRALEGARTPDLGLRRAGSPYPAVWAYAQGNALASRKKLLPVVRDFLLEREVNPPSPPTPATPVNSLAEGCPLDGLSPQGLAERVSRSLEERTPRADL